MTELPTKKELFNELRLKLLHKIVNLSNHEEWDEHDLMEDYDVDEDRWALGDKFCEVAAEVESILKTHIYNLENPYDGDTLSVN